MTGQVRVGRLGVNRCGCRDCSSVRGERHADLARELGYADTSGVLRVVQRLEAAAEADRQLRRTLERLRGTVHLP